MSLYRICRFCTHHLLQQISITKYGHGQASLTQLARKLQEVQGNTIISCKRKELNYYGGQTYSKFDEIQLASKGWNHSKAKGDFFVIHPNPAACESTPHKSFEEVQLDSRLAEVLRAQQIPDLTEFQAQAFSLLMQGEYAILAAETGCGKTLAYLLPIIQKLIGKDTEQMNTPHALIVAPSRELAYQISRVAEPLAKAVGLNLRTNVGGRTKLFMLNPEFSQIDLLIGTPGSIAKLSNVGIFRLNNVKYTVLDEADTLLDDSFVDRITGIIKRVSQSQLSLVSATLPQKIPPILEPYEQQFVQLTSPMLHKPLWNVTQRFLRLIRSAKPPQMLQIAKKANEPLLVFSNRNSSCYWLSKFFADNGLKCSRISGDMNYAERIQEWENFMNGKRNILISTDVGSRGLDTTRIKHVVNYDFPLYAADYLHRIGRTGRFGSLEHCKVTSFISGPEEINLVQKIELAVRRNEPLPNVDGNITRILQNKIKRKQREDAIIT